ncbi:MAG: ferredoxin reductase, partial [Burkholderiaceae bacterium]
MEMQAVVVRRKWAAADGIAAFELARPDGISMPAFTPGAHITVHVVPPGQPALLRTYSLCNAPGELDCYVLGVKREAASRGGSAAMHDAVNVGDTLEISAPQNHFPLSGQASSHMLLGAGIGITP